MKNAYSPTCHHGVIRNCPHSSAKGDADFHLKVRHLCRLSEAKVIFVSIVLFLAWCNRPRQDVLPGRMGAFISVSYRGVGATTPPSTIAFSQSRSSLGTRSWPLNGSIDHDLSLSERIACITLEFLLF